MSRALVEERPNRLFADLSASERDLVLRSAAQREP